MIQRHAFLALASVAAGIPLAMLLIAALAGQPPTFNDFHSYWLAGRLLLEGRSPYDLEAMRTLGQAEGLPFVLGTGYSYPIPFAFLMIPFALLPFELAVLLFTVISVVGFGCVVGWWLIRHHPDASRRRLMAAAALAGLFPPVYGTIANGQANLVVLVPLGFGLALVAGDRPSGRIGGSLLGVAAIVKIVPAALAIVLLLARRWTPVLALSVVAVGALIAADALAPRGALGSTWLWRLLEPDPYFTNQSINGFVSRLVLESGRSIPLWPSAFDPLVVAGIATSAVALVTLVILLKSIAVATRYPVLALGLALALVAATIGAPKNSFWNQALALPALGLLLAVEAPNLDLRRFGSGDRALLLGCLIGSGVQFVLWIAPLPKHGPLAAFSTLAGSAALYGMLALWALLARRLLREGRRRPRAGHSPAQTGLPRPS
ncbi:MAG: glycosyltransferase family 87 protein [Chloroflexota bacterium]